MREKVLHQVLGEEREEEDRAHQLSLHQALPSELQSAGDFSTRYTNNDLIYI